MSIPAVLYDHVPIDDLKDEVDGAWKESEGVSFYVSSMIHRTSAPWEDLGSSNGRNSDPSRSSRFTEEDRNDNHEKKDPEKETDNSNVIDIDNEIVEDIELDDRPMETIIEDIDFDYVLIRIPPPILPGDNDEEEDTDSQKNSPNANKDTICNKLRTCSRNLLGAVTSSSKSKWISSTLFRNDNDNSYVQKCISKCASLGSHALLRPLQVYARDFLVSTSSIYSSYDWVSETIVDGNRLILPGSCIALDGGDSNDSGEHEGTLIVPAAAGSDALQHESKTCMGALPSPSSIWASKTIMVSAHDLLAVKQDQRTQLGDRDDPRPLSLFEAIEEANEKRGTRHGRYYYRDAEFNLDSSSIMEGTTHTIAQQWTRALWKLAERKAKIWYCISRAYLQKSLHNAGRTIVHSRQYLIRHYYYQSSSKHRQGNRSLLITNSSSIDRSRKDIDENQGTYWDTCNSMVFSTIGVQPLSNRSLRDQMTSDEIIKGCDFGTRVLECTSVIEMATAASKRR